MSDIRRSDSELMFPVSKIWCENFTMKSLKGISSFQNHKCSECQACKNTVLGIISKLNQHMVYRMQPNIEFEKSIWLQIKSNCLQNKGNARKKLRLKLRFYISLSIITGPQLFNVYQFLISCTIIHSNKSVIFTSFKGFN